MNYPETRKTLLAKIISGDEVSWKEFYDRYIPVIAFVGKLYNFSDADCDDLVQNTIKNIMSKGYTRMQVFGAKCISCCVGATIMFVVVELAAALIGTGMYGFGQTLDGDFWGVLATQYVANMANVLLCIAICAKFRKIGTSIMGIIFLPDVVAMVLALADGIWKTSVSQYWFTAFLNETAMLHWTFNSVLRECLLGSAIYLPVFCSLGLSFFKKREL